MAVTRRNDALEFTANADTHTCLSNYTIVAVKLSGGSEAKSYALHLGTSGTAPVWTHVCGEKNTLDQIRAQTGGTLRLVTNDTGTGFLVTAYLR